MVDKPKPAKVLVTLPAWIDEKLQEWADVEQRSKASWAALVLEKSVKTAMKEGIISNPPKLPDNVLGDLEELLKGLAIGECPNKGKLIALSNALGFDVDVLIDVCERVTQSENS